ncbi:MAG: glutaminase [Pseudomonadota bacterium]
MSADLAHLVDQAVRHARPLCGEGTVANYIPALAAVDPNQIGLAVATLDGAVHQAGDAETPFSIQSISKVFTLSMVLEQTGEALWEGVGREPSGTAFNSIVQLEAEKGIPRNPFINAGAIAVTDRLIGSATAADTIAAILAFMRERCSDDGAVIDQIVARSESDTGARNRSLAHFMAAFGNLTHPVETVLDVYFHQCALALSPRQLAQSALYLANDGRDVCSGRQVLTAERCRRLNAVMMSCGHYDNSGEFAFRVGLPGKSGVGGGILAVAPGRGVVVAWSPALNAAGTSLAGAAAIEAFTSAAGWSVFESAC